MPLHALLRQGNKQYEADHDADLMRSNSIVFNAFIFMQVGLHS